MPGPLLAAGHIVMGFSKKNWGDGAKQNMMTICQRYCTCTSDGMGRQKANGVPKRQIDWGVPEGKWVGAPEGNWIGNDPVAMKPNEMAMNPWCEAGIKGSESMA